MSSDVREPSSVEPGGFETIVRDAVEFGAAELLMGPKEGADGPAAFDRFHLATATVAVAREALPVWALTPILERAVEHFMELARPLIERRVTQDGGSDLMGSKGLAYSGRERLVMRHDATRDALLRVIDAATVTEAHRLVLQTLASWPPAEDADEMRRRYARRYALDHAVECSDLERVERLVLDADYLGARFRDKGLIPILADLERIDAETELGKSFRGLAEALRFESDRLRRYPEEFASIVMNRLALGARDSGRQALRVAVREVRRSSTFVDRLCNELQSILQGTDSTWSEDHEPPERFLESALAADIAIVLLDRDNMLGGPLLRPFQELRTRAEQDQAFLVLLLLIDPVSEQDLAQTPFATRHPRIKPIAVDKKSIASLRSRVWPDLNLHTQLVQSGGTAELHIAGAPPGLRVRSCHGAARTEVGTRLYAGHTAPVTGAAFSPDGEFVLTWSDDATLRWWGLGLDKTVRVLAGHTAPITGAVLFSSPGSDSSGTVQSGIPEDDPRNPATIGDSASDTAWSASLDGTVRRWDLRSGLIVDGFDGSGAAALGMGRAQDLVFWWTDDGLVHVLDTADADARPRQIMPEDDRVRVTACVTHLSWQPDPVIIAGRQDGSLVARSLSDGKLFSRIEGGTATAVTSLAIDTTKARLVSGCEDGSVRLYDLPSGACLHVLRGHDLAVRDVELIPDRDLVATASRDRTVRLWRTDSGLERTLEGHRAAVVSCSVIDDRSPPRLVTASADRTLRVWDLEDGSSRTLREHTGPLRGCAVSGARSLGGARIVSFGDDRVARTWDEGAYEAGVPISSQSFSLNQSAELSGREPNPGIVVGGADPDHVVLVRHEHIELIDLGDSGATVRPSLELSDEMPLIGATTHPQRSAIALWTHSDCTLAEMVGDELERLYATDSVGIVGGLFSSGESFVYWTDTGRIASHLMSKREIEWSRDAHDDRIVGCLLSPNERSIISWSWDGTIRRWSRRSTEGWHIATYAGHDDRVLACALASRTRMLVSGSADCTLRRWALEKGDREQRDAAIAVSDDLGQDVTRCVITPDERRVIACLRGGDIVVTDFETLREIARLRGHADAINDAHVTPDGRGLVTGSDDGTVRLWDLETSSQLGIFRGVAPIGSLVVGKELIAAADERGNLWVLEGREAVAQTERLP